MSCQGYRGDGLVPVLISLEEAHADVGLVRVVWRSSDRAGLRATLYRTEKHGGWTKYADLTSDGEGRLIYEDRQVVPGQTYGYRIGMFVEGVEGFFGETWITVPSVEELALQDPQPNPSPGNAALSFRLRGLGDARLLLFDLGGREVLWINLRTFTRGEHRINLPESHHFSPGLYFLRLSEGAQTRTRKLCFVR